MKIYFTKQNTTLTY